MKHRPGQAVADDSRLYCHKASLLFPWFYVDSICIVLIPCNILTFRKYFTTSNGKPPAH